MKQGGTIHGSNKILLVQQGLSISRSAGTRPAWLILPWFNEGPMNNRSDCKGQRAFLRGGKTHNTVLQHAHDLPQRNNLANEFSRRLSTAAACSGWEADSEGKAPRLRMSSSQEWANTMKQKLLSSCNSHAMSQTAFCSAQGGSTFIRVQF